MQDGLYQVNPEDLVGASEASLGHAKFTQGMLEELHGQAQSLAGQYTGSASIKFVVEQLGKAKKIAQNSVDANQAHYTAHQEAAQIARTTEAKNVSIVS
jgi:uncharacterized protein YukE